MAVIGSAYVQIKAITTGLEKDISSKLQRAFSNVKFDARKAINLDGVDTSGVERSFRDIETASNRSAKRSADAWLGSFGSGKISYYVRRIFYQILWGTPIVGALVGALAQLSGSFLSLASAIGPALNALAVVPGLMAAAGTGALSLVSAFSGIAKAYSAGTKKMASGGGGATKSAVNNAKAIRDAQQSVARATEEAVERVARAERDLSDAYEQAAEDINDAQRNVADAEGELADALDRSRRAQMGVNAAREEAANQLVELGFAARQAAISEGQAAIALERARERLAEVVELPVNHRLRREAQLAYDQAQLNLEEAVKSNQDAAKAANTAAEKGIEGSDGVVEAREAEAEAANEVLEAQRDLADAEDELSKKRVRATRDIQDAQDELARTVRDTNRDIADAQQRLADAYDNVGASAAGAGGGVDQFQQALNALGPDARAFVLYLLSIREEFTKLRDQAARGLFPGLTEALQNIVGGNFLDLLGHGMEIAARAIANVAIQFSNLLNNEFFQGAFNTVMESNVTVIENIGSAFVHLIDLFNTIAAAAAPFTEELSKWLNMKIGGWAEDARGNFSGLQDSISDGVSVFKEIVGIFNDIREAISNLMDAAKPAGDTLLDAFGDAAESFRAFTEANPDRLRAFFDLAGQTTQEFGGLLRDAVNLMFRLGEGPAGESILNVVSILRDEAIPAIDRLFEKLSEAGTAENITHLFTDLIDTLGLLLSSGALDAFINIIEGAISVIQTLAQLPGFGQLVGIIGVLIGSFKALNLIAEVTGFRTLISGAGSAVGAMKRFGDAMRVQQALAAMSGQNIGKIGAAFAVLQARISPFTAAMGRAIAATKLFIVEQAKLLASLAKGAAAWVVNTAKMVANRAATLLVAAGQGIVRAATVAWTAVQWALNAALSANPIGLIVLGIAALVAAFVWLWNNVEGFRNFFINVWEGIQAAVAAVIDWVKANWPLLLAIITGPIGLAVKFVIDHWEQIKDGISAAITWVMEFIGKVMNVIVTIWNNVWNAIVTAVRWYLNMVISIVTTIISGVKAFWDATWNGIKAAAEAIWNGIVAAARWYFNLVVSVISGIINGLRSTWDSIWNGIRNTAITIWNGIVDFFNGAVGRIGSIFSGIADAISRPFKAAFNSIASMWNRTIGSLNLSIPSWVPGVGGNSFSFPKLPLLAKGGTISATHGGMAAILGEAGRDERVTPLRSDGLTDGEHAIITALQDARIGNEVNITVVAQPDMDIQTLARLVSREVAFLGA